MSIEAYFTGLIIGDALGAACDSLSLAHIKATFKTIDSYIDPLPALKKHEEKWKKPALYTSISQIALLTGLLASMRRISAKDLDAAIESNDNESLELTIFRHPGRIYLSFLEHRHGLKTQSMQSTLPITSAHILPVAASLLLAFPAPEKITIADILAYLSAFTSDIMTQVGALLYSKLCASLLLDREKNATGLFSRAIMIAEDAMNQCEHYSSALFDKGLNSVSIQQHIATYKELFTLLSQENDFASKEKLLIAELDAQSKSPVSRATIDHPLAILPFALLLIEKHAAIPSEILFRAAESGGSTLPLCAITGSLTALLWGTESIPENLKQDLINKKKIATLIESISKKKSNHAIVADFFHSEAPLTQKEKEELQAKLKNIHPNTRQTQKKKIPARHKEDELNRHVVESWTKLDKAKWKKTQRKIKQNEDL